MPDVETKLRISAVDTSANAFKLVAQQIEQMTQRVTKSQRVLVESHKTAVGQMTATAAAGYTTLSNLAGYAGIGLGASALIEGVKKSVVLFATVDQQARALHVSTGASLDKVNESYERLDKVAAAARVPVEELRNAFDTLARRFTLAGADAMLPGVAQAAAGMHVNAVEVATFNTQLLKTLGIAKKDVPAAFDSLVGAARGGGVKAAELEAGLSDVSRDMADIGMKGPKALHDVEAAMEAVGEVTKDSASAIEGVKGILDAINTKRLNEALLKQANIRLPYELQKGAKAGLSPLDVAVEQAHRAALIIQRRDRGTIEEAYVKLAKSPAIRQSLQELYRNKDVTASVQARIEGSGGAMAEAAAVMTEGASGSLQSFSNKMIEAGEAVGSFSDHVWRGIERLGAGVDRLTGGATPRVQSPTGGAMLGGKPISGNVGDIGWLNGGARPLIPSEPGSATERTAREQLEAIRRMERASLWSGPGAGPGGRGGSSGAAPGGGTPSGPSGGASPGSRSFRNNNPGNIKFGGFAKSHGATGADSGGFAIFPNEESGTAAHRALWESKGYANTPLSQALPKWSGSGYSAGQLGFQGGQTFSSMSEADKTRLLNAQRKAEGWSGGGATGSAVAAAETMAGKGITDADLQTYLRTGHHPNAAKEAWCAEFVGASLEKGGQHSLPTARATDYLGWGKHVDPKDVKAGDVVVMGRGGTRPRHGQKGHIGLVTGAPVGGRVPTVEGNTGGLVRNKTEPLGIPEFRRGVPDEHMRVKVSYDFDAADVRTHSRAYARRSFNKEARDSRYASYTDMGTPA